LHDRRVLFQDKSGCQRVAPLPPLPKFTEVLAFNPIPDLHSPERDSAPPGWDTRAFFLIARKVKRSKISLMGRIADA
jgi:hypothetical protein